MDGCSFWQFLAARDGYVLANSPPEDMKPPTDEEHDALVQKWG